MVPNGRAQRLFVDLVLLVGLGLLLSVLGPYRTIDEPVGVRTAYWIIACLVAGLTGIALDAWLETRVRGFWQRVLAAALLLTIPVTGFIYLLNLFMLDLPPRWWLLYQLAWQVFVVALLVMALRGLLWRRIVETRTIFAPPLPEAERPLRLRLSVGRRSARLIAVEAEDHYVLVHTDAGTEIVAMRFSEALADLAQAYGFRLHRSWWAAGDAIEAVHWKRGRGEAILSGGLVAPVSRAQAAILKEAGWR